MRSAASKSPAMPTVELITKRAPVMLARFGESWSRSFTNTTGSERFEKKFPKLRRIGVGTMPSTPLPMGSTTQS